MSQPIFLIGFMGAGKSYVGKRLAAAKGLAFMDMDAAIEEKTKRKISDIFSLEGEPYFRALERELLTECLTKRSIVIATGGGVPCFFDNMAQMKQGGKTVFLNPDITILAERLMLQKADRPLIAAQKNMDELKQFIHILLSKRIQYYQQAEQNIQTTDVDSILKLVT